MGSVIGTDSRVVRSELLGGTNGMQEMSMRKKSLQNMSVDYRHYLDCIRHDELAYEVGFFQADFINSRQRCERLISGAYVVSNAFHCDDKVKIIMPLVVGGHKVAEVGDIGLVVDVVRNGWSSDYLVSINGQLLIVPELILETCDEFISEEV